MKFTIAHKLPGRIRLRLGRYTLSTQESAALQSLLQLHHRIVHAEVSGLTGSVLITYSGPSEIILQAVAKIKKTDLVLTETDANAGNGSESFVIDMVKKVAFRYVVKPFLPVPVQKMLTLFRSSSFFRKGFRSLFIHRKISVEVLDAAAIGSSLLQGNYNTASSIMFLLSISEQIEEWSKKRARANLASSLALNIDKVWILEKGEEKQVNASSLILGDLVIVRTGYVIPVDGAVVSGEAMVNQATMTGEPLPVKRDLGKSVYAGTIVEEGSITVEVTALKSDTRINRIIKLIDESENYKSALQSKNERLADAIVPFSFLAAFGTYLFTGNFVKATSIFFVDYSCAIKLSTSLSVLSGLHEASTHKVFIKGGRFLEELAEADTVVFDKTGTLTVAMPIVKGVIPFGDYHRDEVLKLSACLEEHFPHSVAQAVVEKAKQEGLEHQEEHTELEYVIAHGVASKLNGKRVLIGSEHFIFEDEHVKRETSENTFLSEHIKEESVLYLAIDGQLAGILLIDDPVRKTSAQSIAKLQQLGLKVVMLTGDSKKTAKSVAEKLNIDEYHAELMPEEKASYIRNLKAQGKKIIMVGDGINDAPALSLANVGVSMKDSSDIAREVADVTLLSGDLDELVNAIAISATLMKRIKSNYQFILAFNTMLLVLGLNQTIAPNTSALLHNLATLGVGVRSIRPLI